MLILKQLFEFMFNNIIRLIFRVSKCWPVKHCTSFSFLFQIHKSAFRMYPGVQVKVGYLSSSVEVNIIRGVNQ